MRSLVALAVVLLVSAAAAGAYWQFVMVPSQGQAQGGGPGGFPTAVEVAEVRVGPAVSVIDAVGALASNESIVLSPEVDGRIAEINFTEGTSVSKDEVLVVLESSIEEAQLTQAQAQRDLAANNFERANELVKNNVGTVRALDEAQAELRIAEAQMQLARAQLQKRRLRAPFDAEVGLRRVSLGEYVTDGTALVNLEQIDPIKVDFRVPELFLPAVRTGQTIDVVIDAYGDQTFTGEVIAIDPLVDEVGHSVVVRARLPNEDGELRPGLFARVTLAVAERKDAVFVPEQAIIPQAERRFVFTVEDGGDGKLAAAMKPVELGVRRDGEVEVTSGLAAGDRVVTGGILKIRDGSPVTIAGEPPAGGGAPRGEATPSARGDDTDNATAG